MTLLPDADTATLWLDDHAYAARLFANGDAPLLSIADYVAFRRQAAGLLASDVLLVPLAAVCTAWLGEHADVVAAMGRKQRAVAPLRALLADEALRGHLVALTAALRQAFSGEPLVLALPSPRAWVGIARAQAGVDAVATGQAEADSASVYVAEFLRAFGEAGVDGILLLEDAGDLPASADELAWYQPLYNVAGHFRWQTGVMLDGDSAMTTLADGVDFAVARHAIGAAPTLHLLPDAAWADAASLPDPVPPSFARIPQDASPERVLAVIDGLRAGR